MVVKMVYSANYAPGKRQEYLEWVKKSVPIFLAPEELKKMSAYENWLSGNSPQRVVEWEFEDVAAMVKYQAREEIKKLTAEAVDLTTNMDVKVLVLIYEQAK